MDVEKEIKLIIYQKQNITEVITHRHQLYDANNYVKVFGRIISALWKMFSGISCVFNILVPGLIDGGRK